MVHKRIRNHKIRIGKFTPFAIGIVEDDYGLKGWGNVTNLLILSV